MCSGNNEADTVVLVGHDSVNRVLLTQFSICRCRQIGGSPSTPAVST
jgi:hypothetical protein